MNFWQRKLLALLHDPPCKAYNLKEHQEIADSLIQNAELDVKKAKTFFYKVCDHIAAAADRLIFPRPSILKSPFHGDKDSPYHHTLGEGTLIFKNSITPEKAEEIISSNQPVNYDYESVEDQSFDGFEKRIGKDWAKFFIHWRLWKKFVSKEDPHLVFSPADTRIPDHTIWTHCSITSALQGCTEIELGEADYQIKFQFQPAFLLFQLGPVQEFIAQARTTKDLWSGSYLFSFLVAHGIKAVTDRLGPDSIIYPALLDQPLFDFLHKDELYCKVKTLNDNKNLWEEEVGKLSYNSQVLTPNLPNRFLALIPYNKTDIITKAIEEKIREELNNISNACIKYLKKNEIYWDERIEERWKEQLQSFLNFSWQVYPWKNIETTMWLLKQLPFEDHSADNLNKVYDLSRRIPRSDLDPRNYKNENGEIQFDTKNRPIIDNPGFCWSAHYALTDFLLAGRRNTRNFSFFGDPEKLHSRSGVPKDMYSGKEECIGDEKWQDTLYEKLPRKFKENERLGAINIIKRIWDEAYLKEKHHLSHEGFDSVPDVAAYYWGKEELEKCTDNDTKAKIDSFYELIQEAFNKKDKEQAKKFLIEESPRLFFISELKREIKENKTKNEASLHLEKNLLGSLKEIQSRLQSEPTPYIAILAMDGDSMGKWLSGANAPAFKFQLSKEAKEYFEKNNDLKEILDVKRPLFPSYHIELSTALENFSVYLAPYIVTAYYGQLIYAGGDDVLAMLPAEYALSCAYALRKAFRGDPSLVDDKLFKGALPAPKNQWGFVSLNGEWEGWKRKINIPREYHLITMGKNADISAGIAIGHIHSPLQNLVEEARKAEKIAKLSPDNKGYGKKAFVVSLFKRSGEIIQWGSKWDHPSHTHSEEIDSEEIDLPLQILTKLEELYKKKKISGKLPYRISELTSPYCLNKKNDDQLDDDIKQVVKNDISFALDQHFLTNNEEDIKLKEDLFDSLTQYLENCSRLKDFLGPLHTFAFFKKKGDVL
ncbi:type III-B CRISPR-associated protein Cas10/Cmr2 [Methylacidiphilum kamchatkense]|uniref:CRISPR-associated Cmr2 family protein n=1 Tax=Methylacidiphilum kamchatkense Kam1 TaxID=1202785 RepID=A0A516TMR5_9BACT|nr:type III-B CRISPR-associated protein Cas10/Cmr2 [Methylacidiphilum kamchatkense]QDQ42525.1 CRISPR-associated Cmr2 family protein [Methylacidiphilum kamchatkense Kam1]